MKVLGIQNNDLAGACLVDEHGIIAAVSEERFTRKKDDRVWPARSIDYVLAAGGLSLDRLDQLDHIAYGWHAGFDAEKHLPLYFDRIVDETQHNPSGLQLFRQRILDEIHNDKEKRAEFDAFLASHELTSKAIYIDHHECHALGAFVCSPFDEAIVVTCDGRGDFQSLSVSRYDPAGHEVLQREATVDSLGYFYGRITALLGYKPNRHEGKITGLAAFGDAKKTLPLMRRMIDLKEGRLRAICGDYFSPSYSGYTEQLTEAIAKEKPEDIAAGAQRHTEELLASIVRKHAQGHRRTNVCLAGGVFGNVKLNQRIREVEGVANVYVLPAMGDGGLALAAAVGTAYLKRGLRYRTATMSLGPDAGRSEQNLELLAERFPGLAYFKPANMIATLVEAIAHDQVLGMFKGRMEFGPRALCNRSIIYHAADTSVNDWLNARMHRTEFMPFAPVSPLELAQDSYIGWEEDQVAAEFMTMTYDCHAGFKQRCPAVVHVDGTARPQIIQRDTDAFMHALLMAWYENSGQPALINTSFNAHEEPIVCDANDAFGALANGIVDLVVMNERYLIWRDKDNGFAERLLNTAAA